MAYKTSFLISGGSLPQQGLEMQNCLKPLFHGANKKLGWISSWAKTIDAKFRVGCLMNSVYVNSHIWQCNKMIVDLFACLLDKFNLSSFCAS